MKYKLVISDYDNTLGKIKHVEPETVEAIKQYNEQGGNFIVCTGRFYHHIKGICRKCGISGLVATCQGSQIRDLKDDSILVDGGIEKELAIKIAKKLISDGVKVCCYIGDRLVYEQTSRYVELYTEHASFTFKTDNMVEYIKNSDSRYVLKFIVAVDESKVSEFTEKYQNYFGEEVVVNSGGSFIIEIINPKFNKGEAVKFIAKYYNIPFSEVMTIGDSTNDLDLVKGEWHGVAVGDGAESLKSVAKEIAVAFPLQPVKQMLDKYCLDK